MLENAPAAPPKLKKRVRFALDEPKKPEAPRTRSLIERIVRLHSVHSRNLFLANYGLPAQEDPSAANLYRGVKSRYEYRGVRGLPQTLRRGASAQTGSPASPEAPDTRLAVVPLPLLPPGGEPPSGDPHKTAGALASIPAEYAKSAEKLASERRKTPQPQWHAPWKLKKVISGHYGWVRAVAVDVSNDWFITGSSDRTIKIWDLATGTLKLTLTGHTTSVRGLVVSDRHPYIFSFGEDKTVRCWDFEQNKVIRKYHGHLSGVYGLSLHPSIDVLVSVGRDSSARVWDVRTKAQIFVLTGHKSTVACVQTQQSEPQIITGSHDHTMRLWDLRKGRTVATLTHHKKSIRDLVVHHEENVFISAAADALKAWLCPRGAFLRDVARCDAIVNTLALNKSNVLVSGGDQGTLKFWDYKTGYNFQSVKAPPQPGSLDSEAGIFASTFDVTGSRLITCEADKTIKIWKEDDEATPETHPVAFKQKRRRPAFQ